MNLASDPYVWIAAALTIGVFTFLYRDNPVFCFIEHLLVGLSTGYLFCTYWHNVFVPELVTPLWQHGLGEEAHLWVVVLLCFLWAGKYVEKTRDLFRLALAFWVAVDLGLQIPTFMEGQVLSQVAGTIQFPSNGSWVEILGTAVLASGTIAALTYFFFSKPQEKVLGQTAKVGIWVLMVGFGVTFSYTIMSRVYLLIGRLLFLLRDWLGLVS